MSFWFWLGIDSGSKDIPRGNKMCMSSGFRNILAKCEQTLSDSTFGLISRSRIIYYTSLIIQKNPQCNHVSEAA